MLVNCNKLLIVDVGVKHIGLLTYIVGRVLATEDGYEQSPVFHEKMTAWIFTAFRSVTVEFSKSLLNDDKRFTAEVFVNIDTLELNIEFIVVAFWFERS